MAIMPLILDPDKNPDAEGTYHGEELHSFDCPCEPCAKFYAQHGRPLSEEEQEERRVAWEASKAERWAMEDEREDAELYAKGRAFWVKITEESERHFLHKDDPDYAELVAAMNGDDEAASTAAGEEYSRRLRETQADFDELRARVTGSTVEEWRNAPAAAEAFALNFKTRATFTHTLPLVPGGTVSQLPSILTRSDGAVLLYEARLNSIFGEPGLAKSWIALMGCIQVLRSGGRCLWWDFEDRPATVVSRLKALGAEDLIESLDLLYATPDLAEDEAEMARMARWVQGGSRPGVVVIDSVESAGLPTDSNDAAPWYESHTRPWERVGAGVVTLDHIPKRAEGRPRGPIGSQHKTARLSGAGLLLSGTPWTKEQGGKITLWNHKDRCGDLPGALMKAVAVVEVEHGDDGQLLWSINPPDDDDDDDLAELTGKLLEAIASHGQEGVKGSRAIRGLVKAKGRQAIDAALDDLIANGMVTRQKDGSAFVYYATEVGMDTFADDDSAGEN